MEREEVFRTEVMAAVMNLLRRGEYPSAGGVVHLNPSLRRGGWEKIQLAIYAAIETATESRL